MPPIITPWDTDYPGSQDDPVTSNQPDLQNATTPDADDGDLTQVSQIHTMRDKLDAVAKKVGDDNSLPASSILDRLDTIEPSEANAVHTTLSGEITTVAEKVSPVSGDWILIEDSADTEAKKKVQIGNLPSSGGASPLTTKGDLYTYDTDDTRLPVGVDGQILTADSDEDTGLKWITSSVAELEASELIIEMLNKQAEGVGTLTTGVGFHALPGTATPPASSSWVQEFEIDVAGVYDITAFLCVLSPIGTNKSSLTEFQLLFDEADFNGHSEQIVGTNGAGPANEWAVSAVTDGVGRTMHACKSAQGLVTLATGTHKVEIEAHVLSDAPRIATEDAMKVVGRLLAGRSTVPEIISGDFIELTDDQPVSNINVTTSGVQIIPESGGGLTFTALNSGRYAVRAGFQCTASTSASTVELNLVFDEGEANEQIHWPGNRWRVRSVAGTYTNTYFETEITLVSGTHTAKLYGTPVTGTTFRIIGSSVTTNTAPFIILHSIGGSSSSSGATDLYIDEFTAAGGDEEFVLSGTPASSINTPSSYNIIAVTVNGVGVSYSATPTDYFEYGYTTLSGVEIKDLAVDDSIEVRYTV